MKVRRHRAYLHPSRPFGRTRRTVIRDYLMPSRHEGERFNAKYLHKVAHLAARKARYERWMNAPEGSPSHVAWEGVV